MPCVVLTGRVFYGERLRPLQRLAVTCAVLGVLHELWRTQAFSWLTLVTALGYPPYMMLRRWMRFDALSGFVLEMLLLAPLAIWLIVAHGPVDAFANRPALWLLVPGMALIGTLAFAAMMAASRLLPLGLSDGAVLKRDVALGEAIGYDAVELAEDSFVLQLRREQDEAVW